LGVQNDGAEQNRKYDEKQETNKEVKARSHQLIELQRTC